MCAFRGTETFRISSDTFQIFCLSLRADVQSQVQDADLSDFLLKMPWGVVLGFGKRADFCEGNTACTFGLFRLSLIARARNSDHRFLSSAEPTSTHLEVLYKIRVVKSTFNSPKVTRCFRIALNGNNKLLMRPFRATRRTNIVTFISPLHHAWQIVPRETEIRAMYKCEVGQSAETKLCYGTSTENVRVLRRQKTLEASHCASPRSSCTHKLTRSNTKSRKMPS